MRYFNVPESSFTRPATGVTHSLKDRLLIPAQDFYSSVGELPVLGKTQLDAMARETWGSGNEYRWYLLFYRNAREIVGFKGYFDYVKRLQIPNFSEYP